MSQLKDWLTAALILFSSKHVGVALSISCSKDIKLSFFFWRLYREGYTQLFPNTQFHAAAPFSDLVEPKGDFLKLTRPHVQKSASWIFWVSNLKNDFTLHHTCSWEVILSAGPVSVVHGYGHNLWELRGKNKRGRSVGTAECVTPCIYIAVAWHTLLCRNARLARPVTHTKAAASYISGMMGSPPLCHRAAQRFYSKLFHSVWGEGVGGGN